MTDTNSPTRSSSKSHGRRFEPILTRDEGDRRGDMPPPPAPLVSVGRVPQSPGKFSSTGPRSTFAPSPSVTIMMESPSDRSASPNGRRSGGSNKTRQPDRAYERHSSANNEPVPTTPSRRAGNVSQRESGATLFTNEERKKRKRLERGIVSPSPRKMTHQQLSYVDSAPQSPPRRPRFSETNKRPGMMETSSHSRIPPPLFRDEDYDVIRENEGQETAKDTKRVPDEMSNSNQVDDITPFMSEDGEPFESPGDWIDGQDDVNFRDESQVDGMILDKYPDLTAGLAMGPQLSRAHLSHSEMSLDEMTESCQLLVDRFIRTAQDAQEILKQKINRMETCTKQIDEHQRKLNISQEQLEARQEQIRVGVQAVISGPMSK